MKQPMKPPILVRGNVDHMDSLSKLTRNLVYMLEGDFDIHIQQMNSMDDQWKDELSPLMEKIKQKEPPARYALSILCHFPLFTFPPDNNTPILVYQPWELNHLPTQWINYMNKYAKMVIGTCQYNASTFSGELDVMVDYIPPAIDDIYYQPYNKIETDKHVILYDGGSTWRKGIDLILRLMEHFRGQDNIQFIYKDTPVYMNNIFPVINQIGINCEYYYKRMSPTELHDLYRMADVYIYPSRGEGFGYGAAQALTMGVKTVTCNHTGLDYAQQSNAYIIPSNNTELKDITKWLSPEYGLKFNKTLTYHEPDLGGFIAATMDALLAKNPKHGSDYYRRYMNKYRMKEVKSKWLEIINFLI